MQKEQDAWTTAALGTYFSDSRLGERELFSAALATRAQLYSHDVAGYIAGTRDTLQNSLTTLAEQLELRLAWVDSRDGAITYWYLGTNRLLRAAARGARENEKGNDDYFHVTAILHTLESSNVEKLNLFAARMDPPPPVTETGYIEVLVQDGIQIGTRTLGQVTQPLIRENYAPDVLAYYDALCINCKTANPNGRLTIVQGPPGTGKTYLLQGLLHELTDITTWFVPPSLLDELTGPSLLKLLLDRDTSQPLLLLLEDGDACLSLRKKGDLVTAQSAIQALLSIADGFIGQMLNIHVVVTANVDKSDIDPALLRPGRLHRCFTVGPLYTEQARTLYKRLAPTAREPWWWHDPSITLATVYASVKEAP